MSNVKLTKAQKEQIEYEEGLLLARQAHRNRVRFIAGLQWWLTVVFVGVPTTALGVVMYFWIASLFN